MYLKPLEEQYYFLALDIRKDDDVSHLDIPWVNKDRKLNKHQGLRWRSNTPLEPIGNIANRADPEEIDSQEAFDGVDILPEANTLLMKKHARNLIMHLVPKETQFFSAYIQTSKGDVYDDWFVLHVWKRWDCWDRKRSKFLEYDGDVSDEEFEKLYLDESKVFSVPEGERLIIHLDALDDACLLFHESLVNTLLNAKMKGALFVPLKLFGPGGRWWYDNSEEINKLHPW